MQKNQIPLWLAIIININVMIGAGVFINPAPLTKLAGVLGCFSYLGVALLFLPLVLAIARLAQIYPNTYGGLYVYSKQELGHFFGKISGLTYFFGKIFSCAVLAKTFGIYFANSISLNHLISPELISSITILLLCSFNLFGLKTSSKVQFGFIVFKFLPILLVLLTAYFIINTNNFQISFDTIIGFTSSLPIAMYGLLGFESCCSIGTSLDKPEKNLYKAVLYSFIATALTYTLFQSALYGAIGQALASSTVPISEYAQRLASLSVLVSKISSPFLNSALLVSVLGSCYGILFFNSWNGYALSCEINFYPIKRIFRKLNHHDMPFSVVFFQGFIACIFVLLPINTVTLARLAVLGVVITYFMSGISLVVHNLRLKKYDFYFLTSILGLFTSSFIAITCIKDLL